MKHLLLFALLASPLLSHAQVEFNVTVGEPGYYGQIYFNNDQQPQVMNATPVVAYQGQPGYAPPIYLRVPLYVYENWQQYCRDYNACYTPVYFVENDWYQRFYTPWSRNRYPYYIPKYEHRYSYDVPRYDNSYPYNVPKYAPAPRGNAIWHGDTLPERFQRNNNQDDIQRDENRFQQNGDR